MVAFTNARNAFDTGDYREAASRFSAMIDSGLDNEALLIETYKYLGVCYIFLSDEKNAEQQFLNLLNLEPDFKLDPLVFPIDVVDFFTAVKREHSLELEKIAKAEARAEEARKRAEEKRRLEEIDRLRTIVYVERKEKWHSRLVSVMPLGAGQFQNGHRIKGIVFLSGELLLTSACIITYALHENLRHKSTTIIYSSSVIENYEKEERIYRTSNRLLVGALGLMTLAGIIDSMIHFKPVTVTWKKVDESEVPQNLRRKKKKNTPQALLTPWLDSLGGGVGAVGFF
ncbi:MAG: hypothetical protein JXR76_23665 [Deltaproteobacteria bacterium]|nr:hypothetical protein [Deltaproteobacteria bacterium]